MISAIYEGTLMHVRRTPTRNRFRYPVAYFLLDVDEVPELERRLRLFGRVVSLRNSDHFNGGSIKEEVVALAGDPTIERVLMLTQLRVFGYVFNPVTFYWCYRKDGELACIVA